LLLEYILFIETEMPSVHLYSRGGDGRWEDKVVKGLDEVIGFPKLQVMLKLAEIYDGLQFRERPKLVEGAPTEDEAASSHSTK
jgi:hypothetical protein